MAVWQVKILAVPSRVPTQAEWLGHLYPVLSARLNVLLPSGTSWHEDLHCWGRQGGHQIDVWTRRESDGEFVIRIDLRDDFYDFVEHVSLLLQDLQYNIMQKQDQLEASPDAIHAIIRSSDAARFVKNPSQYIEEQSQKAR